MGRISHPHSGVPVRSCSVVLSRSTCLPWKRTSPIRWGSTLTTSISGSRFTITWEIWYFSFSNNIIRLLHPLLKKMRWSRSTTISNELASCSRHSTRRRSERRLLLRCPLRKMMQSWSHRLRSITHSLRRQPARCPRYVRRPLTAGRLMFHLSSLGSYNLYTDCRPRLPSQQHLSCSPCAARPKTSSSTTPGPVISRDCTSSRLLLPLPCHRWSSGLITRPVSTATSLWNPWRPNSRRRVNACQKVMHLRLLQWPLCQATPPSSRTKRCASSSWRPDSSPIKLFLPFEY